MFISNNLFECGFVYSLAEDYVDVDLFFVGIEFSCFFSLDGGEYWKKLSVGLLIIVVWDIVI